MTTIKSNYSHINHRPQWFKARQDLLTTMIDDCNANRYEMRIKVGSNNIWLNGDEMGALLTMLHQHYATMLYQETEED